VKPIRLQIENLRSFRARRDIDFDALQIVAIVGDTGAGKTSILEAITYALFNRSTWSGRNVKELITRGASTMTVSFTFSVDGVKYEILRITKARGASQHRLSCEERGIDVSGEADVEKAVRNALHLDDTAFLHTVLLPQDKHAELLTKDQRERNRILSELFRLDDLAKVGELARTHDARADMALSGLRQQRALYGDDPSAAVTEAKRAVELAEEALQRAKAAVDAAEAIDLQTATCDQTVAQHQQRLDSIAPTQDVLGKLEYLDAVEKKLSPLAAQQEQARAGAEASKKEAEVEAQRLRDAGRDSTTLRGVKRSLEIVATELREVEDERTRESEAKLKRADAFRRVTNTKSALADAEANYVEAEAARARASDTLRGHEARANGLELALTDQRNTFGRRDTLLTRSNLKKQRIEEARAQVEKAEDVLIAAQQSYDEATKAREQAQVTQQAAYVASHLHPGDDCPVCHRALPDGFSAPAISELSEAQETERNAQNALTDAAAQKNTFAERLRSESDALHQLDRDLVDTEKEVQDITARLQALLLLPDDDPQAFLETCKRSAADEQQRLVGLRESVAECNDALSNARVESASAETDHRHYSESLGQVTASIATRLERCKSVCSSIPQPLRPILDTKSVEGRLRDVDELTRAAETVDARIVDAVEAIAAAVDETSALQQRITNEVLVPRTALYEQLRAVSHLLNVPTMPAREDARPNWARSVDRAANGERSRLAGAIRELGARREALLVEREAIVSKAGGEPRAMASQALVEKRDAEHAVEDATAKASHASAIDVKIAKLEPVRMGLSSLRDALGAREFPAFATQQRQRRLLEEATMIFREMTDGRYGFTEEFEIFDGETNDARSPHTLSGGEKFLASLALSLAVVEIASNAGAKIEALFLDEGFASLDAATLEQAMLELRKRSRSGRMIFVISHLSQVTQFVDDTILVEETAEGSKIERQVGPLEDDASAVEGLVSHLATHLT